MEQIVVLAVVGLVVAGGAVDLVAWRQRARLLAAARGVALSARALRGRAVASGRGHALWIREQSGTLVWEAFRDGDGDGVRQRDIASGRDPAVGSPTVLADASPGIEPGLPPGVRDLDGRRGGDAVRFGRSDLASFGPDGTATSGTLYLRDRHGNGAAVRIYGPTGRVALWELWHGGGWSRRW